jgi:hypothetical protein
MTFLSRTVSPRRGLVLAASALLIAAACARSTSPSNSSSTTAGARVATLQVVLGNGASFAVGSNFADTISVRALDSTGTPIANAAISWYAEPDCCSSALNTSGIALITPLPARVSCPQSLKSVAADTVCSATDATGTARAVWFFGGSGAGSAQAFSGQTRVGALQLLATASGNPVDTFTVTAGPGALTTLTLTLVGNNGVVCVGHTWQSTVSTATDLFGNAVVVSASALTWSTSNAAVATVSSGGLVTGVGGGSATITATDGGVQATEAVFGSAVCNGPGESPR